MIAIVVKPRKLSRIKEVGRWNVIPYQAWMIEVP